MELKYMKLELHLVLEFTRSEYARQRVQNYLRKMPLEKFPVEIESLKLDFYWQLFMYMLLQWKSSL